MDAIEVQNFELCTKLQCLEHFIIVHAKDKNGVLARNWHGEKLNLIYKTK